MGFIPLRAMVDSYLVRPGRIVRQAGEVQSSPQELAAGEGVDEDAPWHTAPVLSRYKL